MLPHLLLPLLSVYISWTVLLCDGVPVGKGKKSIIDPATFSPPLILSPAEFNKEITAQRAIIAAMRKANRENSQAGQSTMSTPHFNWENWQDSLIPPHSSRLSSNELHYQLRGGEVGTSTSRPGSRSTSIVQVAQSGQVARSWIPTDAEYEELRQKQKKILSEILPPAPKQNSVFQKIKKSTVEAIKRMSIRVPRVSGGRKRKSPRQWETGDGSDHRTPLEGPTQSRHQEISRSRGE